MFPAGESGEDRYEVSVKRIQRSNSGHGSITEEPSNWRNARKLAPDLSSALWLGEIHHFTPQQGLAVKSLWDAMESGLPDVHQRDILAKAGSHEAKLRKLFDGSTAWGRMIFPSRDFGGRAGYYRLAPPPEKRPETSDE